MDVFSDAYGYADETFNVGRVVKISKKLGVGLNVLLCWCIAKAASKMEVFYLLPISFQFYHVQMDGSDGVIFLELL